jgi:UDP-N-acetylmuramate--alanine ligase
MIPAGAHVHFIGIGGAGMSALAQVLAGRGLLVSGCDLRASEATGRLRRAGCTVEVGHDAAHLRPAHLRRVDVVVVSRAIAEDTPELRAARELGLPIRHRAEVLAYVMATGRSIGVVGTHGKTTTTAMLARVLTAGGCDPTALIGADVSEYGGNVRIGGGQWIVAEVDESDGSLVHVTPFAAVLTSLDVTDHRDYYTSVGHLTETFLRFLRGVDDRGYVVVCVDHPEVRRLREHLARPVMTYGFSADADMRGEIIAVQTATTRTALWYGGRRAGELVLEVPGRHNVSNALGAIAAAAQAGVPLDTAVEALRGFRGASRRFAVRGEEGGVLVVDDYAHNPVKVAAVIHAAREGWPHRRVIVLFQPHRFSRTRTTFAEYGGVFQAADEVVVTEIYAADETPLPGVSARLIVDEIARQRPVHFRSTTNDALDLLESLVAPGDMVLTLGAGDIGAAADAFLARLAARDAGRRAQAAAQTEGGS